MGSHPGLPSGAGNVLTRPGEAPGTCLPSTITPGDAEWRALRCAPVDPVHIAAARAWGAYLGHAWHTGEEITAAGLARYQLRAAGGAP
jgi:hypothetical protein